MTTIKVCREPTYPGECRGDDDNLNWGPDVSEILLSTEAAARERGRIEVDRQFTNRKPATLSLHQIDFVQPGIVIATADVDSIEIGQAKQLHIKISRSLNSISIGSDIIMEKNE